MSRRRARKEDEERRRTCYAVVKYIEMLLRSVSGVFLPSPALCGSSGGPTGTVTAVCPDLRPVWGMPGRSHSGIHPSITRRFPNSTAARYTCCLDPMGRGGDPIVPCVACMDESGAPCAGVEGIVVQIHHPSR